MTTSTPTPTLTLAPRRGALLAGEDNRLEVLVRIEAPERPAAAAGRSPLNVALVLDRSGSMSGRPLAEASRCARFAVDRLGRSDRASLVVYDGEADLLVPSSRAADRQRFHDAIRRVRSGGTTNLHGGWLKGAEQVSAHVAPDTVSRVILLSDGMANRGLTDVSGISRQCAELADAGVSTSTYGLGDGFNEELMIEMARAGQGNSYYGETADDLMDPFMDEFDLLAAICAKRVRFSVETPEGVTVEVLNELTRRRRDGDYRLPDLAFDAETWALVRVHVPAALARGGGRPSTPVLRVVARCRDVDGGLHELPAAALKLPAVPEAEWRGLAEDEDVARRVAELEAAEAQDRARRAARAGDWRQVRAQMREVRAHAGDDEFLNRATDELDGLVAEEDRTMFMKEAAYSSRERRGSIRGARRAMASGSMPRHLERKARQGRRRDD